MTSVSLLRQNGDLGHESDPESNRLLPPSDRRRMRHQVRIQGRLVLVRSVSAMHLPPPSPSPSSSSPSPSTVPQPAVPRHDPAVGSVVGRRRRQGKSQKQQQQQGSRQPSLDDGTSDTDEEEDTNETARRDRQRRGYGIGGAGNIRRPTEVPFLSSRTGGVASRPRTAHGTEQGAQDGQDGDGTREPRPWAWMRSLLGRRGGRPTENAP